MFVGPLLPYFTSQVISKGTHYFQDVYIQINSLDGVLHDDGRSVEKRETFLLRATSNNFPVGIGHM